MVAAWGRLGAWLPVVYACALLLLTVASPGVDARGRLASVGRGKGQLEGRTKDRRQQDTGHLTLTTAQCLAHCFTELDIAPTSDHDCQQKPMCKTCAHMCELLQTHSTTWRRACRPPYTSCDKGCRAACSHNFHPSLDHDSTLKWSFPSVPSVSRIGRSTLRFNWAQPRPLARMDVTSRDVKFVYVIMQQEKGTWSPLKWTTTAHARIQTSPSDPQHHFRLLAVTPEGVAANSSIPEMVLPTPRAVTPADDPEEDSSGEIPVLHAPPKVEPIAPGVFDPIAVSVSDVTSGQVDAVIAWQQRLQPSIASAVYVLKWSRTSCNVDKTYPRCNQPTTTHTMNITVSKKKSVRVSIKQLTFNAKYIIDVGFISQPAQRVHLVTPPCHHPDVTFKRCHQSAAAIGLPHVTSPETKMATTGPVQDALVEAAGHEEDNNKVNAQKATSKPNKAAMVAGFVSFLCVATVCIGVASYVIYRRWVHNKQTARLHSLRLDPRSLWTPAATLQPLGTPGSFRRNPLSAQLSPESLQGLTNEEDSLESVELPRSMWTRLPTDAHGALQHVTLTPEVTSLQNDEILSRDLLKGHPILRRTSTKGPLPVVPTRGQHNSPDDLQDGQMSPRRASTVTFNSNDLQISSIRDELDNDIEGDFETSLAYKCNTDFSASLHLSMVDPDGFSDTDLEESPSDDLRRPTFTSFRPPPLVKPESFSDPPSCTTSFSTQEGSYLVCSPDSSRVGEHIPDTTHEGEQTPFLPVSEAAQEGEQTPFLAEHNESLSQEIQTVLDVLDGVYYESFFS